MDKPRRFIFCTLGLCTVPVPKPIKRAALPIPTLWSAPAELMTAYPVTPKITDADLHTAKASPLAPYACAVEISAFATPGGASRGEAARMRQAFWLTPECVPPFSRWDVMRVPGKVWLWGGSCCGR